MISPLEGERAGKPEGVGPTGLGPLSQTNGVGALCDATPSVAFGDILKGGD